MTLLLILRIIHVVAGVFWAGTMFFIVWLLEPSVRSVGPDGAKVMGQLQARGFMNIMPTAAAVTILSGVALFWRILGRPGAAWVASGYGISLVIGGITALAAFGIGVGVLRPSTVRAGTIMGGIAGMRDGEDKTAALGMVQDLRLRARSAGRLVAVLLMVAVVTMAVARYM